MLCCLGGLCYDAAMANKRVFSFIRNVVVVLAIIVLIGVVVWVVQSTTGLLDPLIVEAQRLLELANGVLDTPLMAGISASMIVLSLVVLFIPLLMKGIQKKQYLTAVRRGIVASGVFFVSQLLYAWAETEGRSILLVSMVLVLVGSFILIELLARMLRAEEEASFRTDMVASMASGLMSGMVLKLVGILLEGKLPW